jgi:hypothetical protein
MMGEIEVWVRSPNRLDYRYRRLDYSITQPWDLSGDAFVSGDNP